MNRKKWTVLAIIGLLLAANLFLIFKKESKIERAAYIGEWTEVKEQDLVLSKNKSGVLVPAQEEYVYYQAGSGIFEEFLVSEGEEVRSGEALFEYSPVDIEATISSFEAEISKLDREKEALEDNIDDLEKLERTTSFGDDNPYADSIVNSFSAEISEKKWELGKVEAEIDKYNDLIDIAEDGLRSLTVDSGMAGVVKDISYELQNPVVTITSHDMKVEGVLDEDEVLEIAEGMEVAITSNKLPEKLKGTVSSVSVNPISDPKLDEESQYSFTVELEEQPETLIPVGANVGLKIKVAEAQDVLTVSEKAIRKDSIFVLGRDGKVQKREIEKGLVVGKTVELISEGEEGELVAYEPEGLKNQAPYFTPINISKLSKTELTTMPKKEILRYIGRGLLTK
ncbi:efflux RND transporter periplasmic adaptor subunit [Bacillus dakarensis]|uniref:efflux RND transporter periplasmic adaptor subunit n=1 Tax=Robertmurraya dakarensis TaxID=1926278 RepID=UPI0009824738|nr:HlyD family efflux transporter periplasmic adaptor subunit [Bacillus dakarensis]